MPALDIDPALALGVAEHAGLAADSALTQQTSDEFRRARGLVGETETAAWLRAKDLDLVAFSRLMHDEALIEAAGDRVRDAVVGQVPSVLRVLGQYPAFREAALDRCSDGKGCGLQPEDGSPELERERTAHTGLASQASAVDGTSR